MLTTAFGQEIDQRLRDFSRLLTHLVLELTNADLLATNACGAAMARQMEDQLQRQHQALTLGASLSFERSRDSLDHGGRLEADTWQAGLFALLNDGEPAWLGGEISAGHTRFDSKRSVYIQASNGPVLLEQRSSDTSAWFWGARLEGGYDFSFGALKTGPVAGQDYADRATGVFAEVNSRFAHSEGDQTGYSLGVQWMF